MVGFDLESPTGKLNNVYKGQDNYAPAKNKSVSPRKWVKHIDTVMREFPNTQFIRVIPGVSFFIPEEGYQLGRIPLENGTGNTIMEKLETGWKYLPNLTHWNIEDFKKGYQ
jgi:hypothetical protein